MTKLNCWEYLKCGREPGGAKEKDLGVCSATTEKRTDGVNEGKNGGRACWAVAGTLCGGDVQGSFVDKMNNCMDCEFYEVVRDEEGDNYKSSRGIIDLLND